MFHHKNILDKDNIFIYYRGLFAAIIAQAYLGFLRNIYDGAFCENNQRLRQQNPSVWRHLISNT